MQEIIQLKENDCKDCYKCIRNCSVKAISFAEDRAEIIQKECILCGRCFVVCPQKAKRIRSDLERVKDALKAGQEVYASIAPSFIADFHVSGFAAMEKALSQLGFAGAEETAVGAQLVSDEYARLMKEHKTPVLISSCCPSVNLLIQKYYPSALPYLAPVLTPAQAHCQQLRQQHPGALTVFIGPCIAKKSESDTCPQIDAALTYDELRLWLTEKGIELPQGDVEEQSGKKSRFYPTTGGVLKATENVPGYRRVAIDGVDNCRAVLAELENGGMTGVFIEMNACEGGCVNGPCIREHREKRLLGALRVGSFAGDERFDTQGEPDMNTSFAFLGSGQPNLGGEAIRAMLLKMGKDSPEKELNCGCCGYDTCRDKAAAILQGKAEISMCLPFLKEKAESFSDTIINNTPNAIFVMNEDLIVEQVNRAAVKMFHLTDEKDILHEHVVRILNPEPYLSAVTEARNSYHHCRYLAEYKLYVEETVLYDRQYHVLISIMRDVTERENLRASGEQIRQRTLETTDKVIDKQMRVVQEIASLLGETTAETKVALDKLKDAMNHE